jgi:hypothetical protein
MPNFELLAYVHIGVGYQLFVYPFVHVSGWTYTGAEACLIVAFLCYITAFLLLSLIKFSSLKGNKIAFIATAVLAFVAGACGTRLYLTFEVKVKVKVKVK